MKYTVKLRRKAAFSLSSVAAMKIIENSSISDKMKYEFNFLNKELCQIFFSVF